jgi:hypothetical protein
MFLIGLRSPFCKQCHLFEILFIPGYSRCVGVELAKACFIGVLLQAPSLWFRQVTHDMKLTNLQNLPPRPENRFKGQARRLSS